MDVDAVLLLAVNIAAALGTPVDDEAFFAVFLCFAGENGTEETAANDEIIILHSGILYGLLCSGPGEQGHVCG